MPRPRARSFLATRRLLIPFLAAVALYAPSVGAQSIRGIVRDGATRAPVAGAVVELLNSAARSVARTITDPNGRYSLGAEGASRLRVIHIGYRPDEQPVSLPRGRSVSLDVVIFPLPTLLQPVRAVASRDCPRTRETGEAMALLELSRDGVLATQVAAEAKPARMTRVVYQREFSASDSISDQAMSTSVGESSTSFTAARTPAEFVRQGFVHDSAGFSQFFAPEAATIVDPAFGRAYCYGITWAHDRPHQVGLTFAPSRRATGRVQVAGTLWTDTLTRTLSDMEFHYVNLDPRMNRASPGGRIGFQQLPNGIVLIHRWSLRLPTATEEEVFGMPGAYRTVFHAVERGGRVAQATWPDGYTWTAGLGRGRILVVDGANQPVPDAMARLEEAGYFLRSDSAGHIDIPYLVAGPWNVIVQDSSIADLPLHREPALRMQAYWGMLATDTVHLASPVAMVTRDFCRHSMRGDASSIVIGVVRDTNGVKPVRDARLTASWEVPGDSAGTVIPVEVRATTNDSGVYAICNVPPSTTVQLRAVRRADSSQVAYVGTSATRTLLRMDFRLGAQPPHDTSSSAPAQRSPVGDGVSEVVPVERQSPDDEHRPGDHGDHRVRPGVASQKGRRHS